MKLLSTITAMCLSIAFATAAEVGAPIQARQGCSITMFTGRGFTGTSSTLSGNQCSAVFEPFVSNLLSAKASPGCVCFLFTGNSCNNCGACVDETGFRDMAKVPAVHSFRCETADAARCSNSNCTFKK